MNTSAYGWLLLIAIIGSFVFWMRLARRDNRLVVLFVAALAGAFLGAKAVYFAAEGWQRLGTPDFWMHLAAGKTILGGLLGGYVSVELAKRLLGYHGVTGDWFATVVPLSIALGRVGCIVHGCCAGRESTASWWTVNDSSGVARWPAAQVELGFNLAAAAVFLALRRRGALTGQHFHVYLMAYGMFRFLHEFARATPAVLGPISGYQIAALALAALGAVRFAQRQKTAGGPAVRMVVGEGPG